MNRCDICGKFRKWEELRETLRKGDIYEDDEARLECIECSPQRFLLPPLCEIYKTMGKVNLND
jgi:hypothetical protein